MTVLTCQSCGRNFDHTKAGQRPNKCTVCRTLDPHRNSHRQPTMFVGVDGEGSQDELMHYRTLSYGREDGTSSTWHVQDGDVASALEWLINELSGPYTDANGRTWRQQPIAFHFNWDISTMLRYFDERDSQLVHRVQARELTPLCSIDHDPATCGTGRPHRWHAPTIFDIITKGGEDDLIGLHSPSGLAFVSTPGRRFYVEHRPHGDRYEEWQRLDIHDVGLSFPGKFMDALDNWHPSISPRQQEMIKWGKTNRVDFNETEPALIAEYSEAECVALAMMARQLLNTLRDATHIPMKESQLFGSGSIAAAAMKFHHVPRRDESDLTDEHIAKLTYFGGMIETPVLGLVKGTVNEVDINSAYPDKCVRLHCMRAGCGKWKRSRSGDFPTSALIGHVRATWDTQRTQTSTRPFMVRTKVGRVRQPIMGLDTWVTLAEYRLAVAFFGDQIGCDLAEWWEPDCQCGRANPFAFMQELYDERARIKTLKKNATDDAEYRKYHAWETVIKLVLNSIYGKTAQQDPDFGPYSNLHIASYITGATRSQVREETWRQEATGNVIIYQHTDSVLSQGVVPTDGGSALGAWKLEKPSTDFLILQPGLAFTLEPGAGKSATRGAPEAIYRKAAREWLERTDLTAHPAKWPTMNVPRKTMISRRMARQLGHPEWAGSFREMPLEISMNSPKRDIDNAYPMPGNPTAWIVPAVLYVPDPATGADVDNLRAEWHEERQRRRMDYHGD